MQCRACIHSTASGCFQTLKARSRYSLTSASSERSDSLLGSMWNSACDVTCSQSVQPSHTWTHGWRQVGATLAGERQHHAWEPLHRQQQRIVCTLR